MKVKNIMFSGFMAAIMMSATAGVANAAVSVASRGYVDQQVGTKVSTSDFNTFNSCKFNCFKDSLVTSNFNITI